MDTTTIDPSMPPHHATGAGATTAATPTSKYGAKRMARYLLRSFEDCLDVCETINRQVQERVGRDDIEPVFREIECWAMAVPNTASDIIVGFGIPGLILENQQTTTHPIRPLQFDFNKNPKPAIMRTNKALVMAHDVKSLFDLNAFNHYLRNPEGLKAQGLELAAIRRTMKMTVRKRDGAKANFALILTCTVESNEEKIAVQAGEKPESHV
jgi:hypothetical protein